MKSEKKSNDLNCGVGSAGIIKEEAVCTTTDSCKMSEKSSCEIPEKDAKPNSKRESNLASTNPEDITNKNNKITGANNKQNLNVVKLENNASYPTDCGGAAGSKSSEMNSLGKCKRNVANSGGESQFMQQQSQVFVFSTMLANKGAEAVLRGQFPSMVAYHCAQPGTKKFLEKHPNKGIKSGQSPAEWLNNFNSSAQKNQQVCNSFTRRTPDLSILDPDSPAFWNEQSNTGNGKCEKSVVSTDSSVDDTINKVVNSQPSPRSIVETNCSSPSNLQPSLQGVKVPDENLTPQQRQHREESLAALRKMQILLFPDKKETSDNFSDANQSTQHQGFRPDGVNSPPVSPLDHFSPDVDWDKFPNQLIDQKNKVAGDNFPAAVPSSGPSCVSTNSRSQGPPPPYNQSARPASVPVALQNSNPSSPNNPTGTLSLPSPRATSALNSPADSSRQFHHGFQRPGYLAAAESPMAQDSLRMPDGIENQLNHSNPGTPGPQTHLVTFSPSASKTQKDSIDFASSQSPSVDEILSQTLQSVNENQQDQVGVTEANLMPVPSPQQIQYLNTFEGQELTIQKQPNTNLKDNNSSSHNAGNVATSTMRILPESTSSILAENTDRRFNEPLPSPRTPRTPSNNTPFDPATMGINVAGDKVKSEHNSPAFHGQNSTENIGRSNNQIAESHKPKEVSPSPKQKQQQQQQLNINCNDSKHTLQSNGQEFTCGRPPTNIRGQPDNVPLNPNNVNNCMNVQSNSNTNHFDPITSLAQMSQQLANITPSNSLQGNATAGMQQNMHLIQDMNSSSGGEFGDLSGFVSGPGGCLPTNYNPAPRPVDMGIPNRPPMVYGPMNPGVYHGEPRGPQRPMQDPHNSMRANVHVRPGAPNTIQYLPAAKPNPCQGGPRGPPSLDFLQGYTNPPNQRCFAGNMGPQPGPMHGIQQGVVFPGMNNRPQRPPGFHTGPSYHPNQMRPQLLPNVHQGPSPIRMQHMVGGGVFQGNRMGLENKQFGGDMMTQISNPRMYVPPGNQGNAMGMRIRGPTMQPGIVHANMEGAGNNFKNGAFIGGPGNPTSDPNYAQQYHNFQQQLYATGTRGSAPNLHMGTNSAPNSFLPER